jgi:serine/threonine protein kinase
VCVCGDAPVHPCADAACAGAPRPRFFRGLQCRGHSHPHSPPPLHQAIGKGAYGVVAAATDTVTGARVAVKKVAGAFDSPADARRALREVRLLRALAHPNVIAVRDVLAPPPGSLADFDAVYIVYELMDADLHAIIASPQPLAPDHWSFFVHQLLTALAACHAAGVLHRDIKPGNLLVNAACDLKLADFGLARVGVGMVEEEGGSGGEGGGGGGGEPASTSTPSASASASATASSPSSAAAFMTEYVVTRWYRAPELLLGAEAYGPAVDVWAAGCVLGELISRRPLFPGRDYLDQLARIVAAIGAPPPTTTKVGEDGGEDAALAWVPSARARAYIRGLPGGGGGGGGGGSPTPPTGLAALVPADTPPAALDLLGRMLAFDPAGRASVAECLAHPFLAGLGEEEEEEEGGGEGGGAEDVASVPPPPPPPQQPRRLTAADVAFEGDASLGEAGLRSLVLAEMAHYPSAAAAAGRGEPGWAAVFVGAGLPVPAGAADDAPDAAAAAVAAVRLDSE